MDAWRRNVCDAFPWYWNANHERGCGLLAEIYCPYPVMAQLAAQALNLQTDDPRGWTITGAHMSHGAPGAGCEWPPRLAPRSSGLVVSFGWMLHLWGV